MEQQRLTSERWRQVKQIFQAAVELSGAERAAYLTDACADDPSLLTDIVSLIAAHERPGSFLDTPAIDLAVESAAAGQGHPLAGQSLGHYQILSLLGKGGMGEVHLAQDTRLNRHVALKLLPAGFTRENERVRRFIREAQAASALNHPNIITIHEIGQASTKLGGVHFIAEEFVEGQTLRQRLAGGRLKLNETIEVASQIAAALNAAHRRGIVHRDIKPENVMVRHDGYIKVLDFGLAKLTEGRAGERESGRAGEEDRSLSHSPTPPLSSIGVVMGTPRYMSPEQARGLEADARTDIFSLGVVLYEMVAGQAPFGGVNAIEVMGAMLNREPAPLSQYNADASAELQRIVTKALRKDRDERYQTSKDLLFDLKSLKQELEFEARRKISTGSGRQAAPSGRRRSRKAIDSLAVLPLANTGADPEMEYLSDGVTESIINSLSQLPKLKVMARSTVFRYKGQAVDPQQAGRELNVRAVLAGGVLQLGASLVISAELINVADGSQLWGEQYKRKLSDIFAVQEEIAREITEKLRLKLTGEEKRRLARRYTQNTDAYHAYLKGRYYWSKRDSALLKKGLEHFRQAIDLDPSYALAYCGLSDSYTLLVVREALSPEEGFAKAKAAATMALQIDGAFAEAHASLGHAMLHNWEWDDAERELKRAVELNPGYPSARHWYSEYLTAMGRCEESIAELKLAGELDPLSLVISTDLGRAFYYARQYDQVMKQEARTLEMEPNFWLSQITLGRSYTQIGMHAEAIHHLQKARELSPGNTEVWSFLGFAYAAAAERDAALKTLCELDEQSKRGHVPPYHFAIVHAGLGEKDQAFEWLERAFEKRAVDLFTLKVEPMFDGLRSDPRFEDLLRRVGLASPESYQTHKHGP